MSEERQQKVTEIMLLYGDMLMTKLHVVGCGVGLAMVGGEYTDEIALIVLVDLKVPEEELAPEDVVPRYLDGVRCDVQETGQIEAF